jgi:tripartite-type tricarboxylate transporter receptor subunit TctC
MASVGIGSTPHVAGELFNMMAGVRMIHVPYRGQGPALTDLLGGQVQVLLPAQPELLNTFALGNSARLPLRRQRGQRSYLTCRP